MANLNSKKIMSDILPRECESGITREETPKKEKDFFEKMSESRKNKTAGKKEIIKETKKNKKNKITYFLAGIFILFALLGFYLTSPASRAVVKIKPISKSVSVNVFLKASSEGGEISFRLIKSDLGKEEKIAATGFEKMEKKAAGAIIIYNMFSPNPQTLIKSTRFETPNGKIYRIDKTISVPGVKLNGDKSVAGSVEVIVYADRAGENYNLEFSDFTIPGFKGTAKYGKIYARSKSPIQGGIIGNIPKVSGADLESASAKLKSNIEKEIFENINREISGNEILFKEGTDISFEASQTLAENSNNSAVLKIKGKFSGAAFNKDGITSYLIDRYLKNSEFKENSYIKNFDSLNFKVAKKDFLNGQIILKIEGDANFVKKINEEKLKEELIASKNKEELFKSRPEIEEAKIILSPPWKKRLPKNHSKIEIQIEE